MTPSMNAWIAAWNGRDEEALALQYAEDACLLHPRMPIVRGRSAIREFLSGATQTVDVAFEPEDLAESEGLAFESGRYLDYKPGTKELVAEGDYAVVYIREEGEWLVLSHAWNDLAEQQP